jgi:hypothetical protein
LYFTIFFNCFQVGEFVDCSINVIDNAGNAKKFAGHKVC